VEPRLATVPLVSIGPARVNLNQLIDAVTSGDSPGDFGAVVTFLGTVRNHNAGRRVHYLEYEAYEPLARRSFELILAEAHARWPTVRLAIHHRTGRLELGESSVAIAAATPHRADGFAACRYAIERVKQIAPIWKREVFEGGEVWIEGATADPDDEAARAAAERVACA
jgi:molybdopterin synthase catalytic subunit